MNQRGYQRSAELIYQKYDNPQIESGESTFPTRKMTGYSLKRERF